MPRATIAVLMISHSETDEPGVTPPLTIEQRKKLSRHSRQASSTRCATSSRVPNTNSRSAGLRGVVIRCFALISEISWSVGNRTWESFTMVSSRDAKTIPCGASFPVGSDASRQQRLREVIESMPARPVVPEEPAALPRKQDGEADQKQAARKFSGDDRP